MSGRGKNGGMVQFVGWSLTALLTQFRPYRAFKVKTMGVCAVPSALYDSSLFY